MKLIDKIYRSVLSPSLLFFLLNKMFYVYMLCKKENKKRRCENTTLEFFSSLFHFAFYGILYVS